ncbi:uncharacterized protein MELLADRAFT_88447 [Melampsora larici-populina 98AG31]|uniref:Uncharacterized protein n=1 Tax=Melampsora larici-populina (strain 98AG31 / pathotype 3-4-7) TaxID=747676 RepID=F4SE63_MELLP|nr:uncharacterized protein MELLADRAFT_88447 [Melampsora larici-populina 98AG31]EGF97064.1 hypothetical protein MELLADRAFT_88447 [Melampsora larici-populina 98AG31]
MSSNSEDMYDFEDDLDSEAGYSENSKQALFNDEPQEPAFYYDESQEGIDVDLYDKEDHYEKQNDAIFDDQEEFNVDPYDKEDYDMIVPHDHSEETTTSPPSKNQSKKKGIKGKKTFALPHDHAAFETFIDEGTTIDDEGYPILPNGNTVYVRQPDQPKITNWGTFAFTYTTAGGGTKGNTATWRTVRFTCLGVIECTNPDCDFLGSPPTAKDKRDEYHEKSVKLLGVMVILNTSNVRTLYVAWTSIVTAGGSFDTLASTIINGLEEGSQINCLRQSLAKDVGRAPAGQKEIVMVSNIHHGFSNLHRLGYYRRKLLEKAGVIPAKSAPGTGDSFIMDMIHWAEQEQLLTRDENKEIYSGGLLSDATYNFFASGYLLSTSMYHDDLRRWIPIQLTWLNGLTKNHYAAHFTTLMKQIRDADTEERDTLVRQVVDFSAAQKNGFIMAYMKVFRENDRSVALDKIKGCHEHFRAQVTRVKRNCAIIPAGDEETFEHDASDLLKESKPGGLTFDQKITRLRKAFPKAKKWLEWWQASDIKAMLFKGSGDLPATTNAQEAMHRVYYMISEGKCSVQIGLVQLYAFVKCLERDHEDRRKGIPIEHGSQAKNYKKVAQALGWAKKSRNP